MLYTNTRKDHTNPQPSHKAPKNSGSSLLDSPASLPCRAKSAPGSKNGKPLCRIPRAPCSRKGHEIEILPHTHRRNPMDGRATDQDKFTAWRRKGILTSWIQKKRGDLGELDGSGRGDDGVAEELGRERKDAVLLRDLGVGQRREDAAEVHAQDLQLHPHHGRLLPWGRRRRASAMEARRDDEQRKPTRDALVKWALCSGLIEQAGPVWTLECWAGLLLKKLIFSNYV